MVNRMRVFIVLPILFFTLFHFWTQSRYPLLNEKSSNAGSTVALIDSLTDRVVIPQEWEDSSVLRRILITTWNWIFANKTGMVAGLIISTLVLTLLNGLRIPRIENPFLNVVLGMMIGMPLGLCANCSAPVGKGLFTGGLKRELSLAMMVSSPSLNLVVWNMVFTLFPFYLGILKVALTLAFIIIFIPLITKMDSVGANPDKSNEGQESIKATTSSPLQEFLEVVLLLGKNGLYLVKRTVPLMFVAGFLGACISHLTPFLSLFNPDHLPQPTLWNISIAAIVCLSLPVPIAVDIIFAFVAFNLGLPIPFVFILLFSLGAFSIYPFMILWGQFSRRMAVATFITFGLLTVIGALVIRVLAERFEVTNPQQYFFNNVKKVSSNGPKAMDGTMNAVDINEYLGRLPMAGGGNSKFPGMQEQYTLLLEDGDSEVWERPLKLNRNSKDKVGKFILKEGHEMGFNEYNEMKVADLFPPLKEGRGIASGDFNNDGFPDVVIGHRHGIHLYLGNGSRFQKKEIRNIDLKDFNTLLVALVDIDNDGHLDIFLGTYRKGNYVLLNDGKGGVQDHILRMPYQTPSVTLAATFGDLDGNGLLDVYIGNWYYGIYSLRASEYHAQSENYLLMNHRHGFTRKEIEDYKGETLSSLMSDFNGDRKLDLIVNNDFYTPDLFFVNDGRGNLDLIKGDENRIESTPWATMSVDTGDVNNDLVTDFLLVGSMYKQPEPNELERRTLSEKENNGASYCSHKKDPVERRICARMEAAKKVISSLPHHNYMDQCEKIRADSVDFQDCLSTTLVFHAIKNKDKTHCQSIPDSQEIHRDLCKRFFDLMEAKGGSGNDRYSLRYRDYLKDPRFIPQQEMSSINTLYLGTGEGKFRKFKQSGNLENTGWSWTSKFADLDNDEWQDIYIVNGDWFNKDKVESNYFFRNIEGRYFEKSEDKYGLADVEMASAYTFIDFDQDGDLDIITNTSNGPLRVFVNETSDNNSITFSLRDQKGNSHAIGAKVVVEYGDEERKRQYREVKMGGGYLSYDSTDLHFGLGKNENIHSVTVYWPDGESRKYGDKFKVNKKYLIRRRQ